jgi:hypothetical protein
MGNLFHPYIHHLPSSFIFFLPKTLDEYPCLSISSIMAGPPHLFDLRSCTLSFLFSLFLPKSLLGESSLTWPSHGLCQPCASSWPNPTSPKPHHGPSPSPLEQALTRPPDRPRTSSRNLDVQRTGTIVPKTLLPLNPSLSRACAAPLLTPPPTSSSRLVLEDEDAPRRPSVHDQALHGHACGAQPGPFSLFSFFPALHLEIHPGPAHSPPPARPRKVPARFFFEMSVNLC